MDYVVSVFNFKNKDCVYETLNYAPGQQHRSKRSNCFTNGKVLLHAINK